MKMKTDKPKKYKLDLEKMPSLTDAQRDEIAKLLELNDDQIDFSDAQETVHENWIHVQKSNFYRPIKQPVTIRLDSDVLIWFKEHAEKGGYQTEINRVLRQHVMQSEKQRA